MKLNCANIYIYIERERERITIDLLVQNANQ